MQTTDFTVPSPVCVYPRGVKRLPALLEKTALPARWPAKGDNMDSVIITSGLRKTNSSYGRWAVDYKTFYPAFNGTAVITGIFSKFFWTKKEAAAFIENHRGETT